MSKAFTKEDVDPPERSGRVRSASGLPPGALNYITARGARRLQEKLAKLKIAAGDKAEKIADLERLIASLTIVEAPEAVEEGIAFGAAVTVRDAAGKLDRYCVVGVEEVEFEPGAISWISPNGKALLAAELGGRVTLEDGRLVTVVKIENLAD